MKCQILGLRSLHVNTTISPSIPSVTLLCFTLTKIWIYSCLHCWRPKQQCNSLFFCCEESISGSRITEVFPPRTDEDDKTNYPVIDDRQPGNSDVRPLIQICSYWLFSSVSSCSLCNAVNIVYLHQYGSSRACGRFKLELNSIPPIIHVFANASAIDTPQKATSTLLQFESCFAMFLTFRNVVVNETHE